MKHLGAANGGIALIATALGFLTPARSSTQVADTIVVTDVAVSEADMGASPVRATVRNPGDTTVLVVLDVRAEPGLWLIPNIQRQFAREIGPGETAVLEGSYAFERLSREARVRVSVGPGEAVRHDGVTYHRLTRVDHRVTVPVGRTSEAAFDPDDFFARSRTGPLTIYAWRGSEADRRRETIVDERLVALQALSDMLAVDPPDSVRLVFYPDEESKIRQTGHRGAGWAFGHTIVEVLNDSVRIDPYHELAHIVAAAVGSPPALLNEGFAIYGSGALGPDALGFLDQPGTSPDALSCAAAADGRVLGLRDLLALEEIGSRPERAALEYAQAGSFVRYLVETGGMDRFREAYEALDLGVEPDENARRLADLYGRSLAELEAGWLEHVAFACGH